MKNEVIAPEYQMMPWPSGASNSATLEDAVRGPEVPDTWSGRAEVVLPEAKKEPREIAFVDLTALFRAG
jgi:hypothetical protein